MHQIRSSLGSQRIKAHYSHAGQGIFQIRILHTETRILNKIRIMVFESPAGDAPYWEGLTGEKEDPHPCVIHPLGF